MLLSYSKTIENKLGVIEPAALPDSYIYVWNKSNTV